MNGMPPAPLGLRFCAWKLGPRHVPGGMEQGSSEGPVSVIRATHEEGVCLRQSSATVSQRTHLLIAAFHVGVPKPALQTQGVRAKDQPEPEPPFPADSVPL